MHGNLHEVDNTGRVYDLVASFTCRHSTGVLCLLALITVLALIALLRVEFNTDFGAMLLRDDEEVEQYLAFQELYRTVDPIIIMVSLPENATFREVDRMDELLRYRDAIADLNGISTVGTFIPRQLPGSGIDLTAQVIRRLPGFLFDQLHQSPVAEVLLSSDGRHTILLATPHPDHLTPLLIQEIESTAGPEGSEVLLAGNPVIFTALENIATGFILFMPPLVIVLSLITFFIVIGDYRLSLIAVVPAILASIWQLGMIVAVGVDISIWTVITPVFITALGSADGLHFVTHYQRSLSFDQSRTVALSETLNRVGTPIILTTLSTAAGFLSLLVTGIVPVQQVGFGTALGILLAGLISLIGLPAIISGLKISPRVSARLRSGGVVIVTIQKWAGRRLAGSLMLTVIVVTGVIAIPRLQVQAGPLFYFHEHSEIRSAFASVEKIFGGFTTLTGEFTIVPDSPLDTQLADLADLSRRMEELPGIQKVLSVADFSMAGGAGFSLDRFRETDIFGMGQLVSQNGIRFYAFLGPYSEDDVSTWRLFSRDQARLRILTGVPILFDSLNREIVRALLKSLLLAVLLIWLILIFVYRRLRESVAAMVPVMLSALALMSFLSITGINLNLSNAFMVCVIIGIGVDYSIHFLAASEHFRPTGDGYLNRSIGYVGLPILANAVGIAAGFSALYLSPMRPHLHTASLMWISMLVAALAALLVIPLFFPARAVRDSASYSSPTYR
ncbi:RND family transporter [Gemmatimonadota bacterium]